MAPRPAWIAVLILAFLLLASGLSWLSRPAAAASAPPAITPGPVLQEAPTRVRAEEVPNPRAGFVPPAMDLSHLTGEWSGPALAALPVRFDWRTSGKVSPVKNQANCSSCYAFAAIAAFESRLLIDGAGLWDFSENNAKECTFYARGCAPGNPMEVYSFFSQKGTALETCDPYVAADVACKTTCPYQKTVLDWRLISGEVVPATDALKNYIYTYGPVHAGLYVGSGGNAWEREFNQYNGSYTLYYAGTQATNHQVTIVGWDDNLVHAGGQGGWIVKNSWGTGWGGTAGYGSEGGYFTIAYGSARIGELSGFVREWQNYDPNGRLLFYDEAGWTSGYGYGSTTAWGLAKFFAPERTNVIRVEFWTTDVTTDVDVYLYDYFNGSTLAGLLASKLNLAYGEAGYHSVAFDTPVPVAAGDDVIAVVKFTNRSFIYPLPVDHIGPHETGRTYLSANGSSWEDLGPHGRDLGIRLRTSPPIATATPTRTLTPTRPPTSTQTLTPTATRTPTVTRPVTGTPTVSPRARRVYLPLVLRVFPRPAPTRTPTPSPTCTPTSPAGQGIYGRVTYRGAAASGIGLALRFFNGTSWSTAATTTTDANGRYAFTGRPSLAPGQRYYVRFGPNNTNPAYLAAWYAPTISTYTAGSSVPGGDFDIANVSLLSPAPAAQLPLPVTFTWQRRELPGDSYKFLVFDPGSDDWWYTDDLGDVGSYVLSGLAQGMVLGKQYGWYVHVNHGSDSYGISYYHRLITFQAGGQGLAPTGLPVLWDREREDERIPPQRAER